MKAESIKSSLRKIYIEKRNALSPKEREERSQAIAEEFFLLPLAGIRLVHVFYPIPGKQEVDALLIADWLRRHYPGIKLVLSKSNPADHTLTHVIWEDYTGLETNKWGITEPATGKAVSPEQLDMIIVPLLAFDTKGNRVGYGKGFYDRFLQQCRPDALKVGLSFFEAESTLIGAEETDVRLDLCVTPGAVYRF